MMSMTNRTFPLTDRQILSLFVDIPTNITSLRGWIWMGYKFEFVQNMVCGELYKIVGLLDSPERIAPEITKTNLEGSYVFFTQHINQYTAAEKRPTASVLKAILDWYDTEKNVRKLGV